MFQTSISPRKSLNKSSIKKISKIKTTQLPKFEQLLKFKNDYNNLQNCYLINGSLGLLHYHFRQKQQLTENDIDLGIQYVESENMGHNQTQQDQFSIIQDKKLFYQENFTDQENQLSQDEPIVYDANKSPQRLATFGTKVSLETTEYNDNVNHQIESINHSEAESFQTLQKTAFFSSENNQKKHEKKSSKKFENPPISLQISHRRRNTTDFPQKQSQNINNSNNLMSKKSQLLNKLEKQKQKKQKLWSKYIQNDKKYLERFLK